MVENNPIECDCNLYDFLRYLDGNMHPYVQNYFHIKPDGLKCHSPQWLADIPVMNLKSTKLKCQVVDPCPKECTCWVKRSDNSFLIDCSHRNLTSVPQNIKTLPNYRLELNLSGNELTRMPPLVEIGLNNAQISKLSLSNNNIYDISTDQLSLNMKVCRIKI